ncbi:methyltransferase [Streptomyces sp. LP05-1]|uniref:Ribosomal RNA large subunit methyltransferase G n=1 Tax=Streptomyces pyxinae TaxID=2970734 RepID=A0ABT2CFJ8_9ACTN|nr:methyltransferase [Streptomyces sp. LP05-1]MCS0636183.1 methyltransferase [Streptomyces sp. LP05-1]
MNRLTTSWADLRLTRFPEDPRDPLRAWDAADEYLLNHLTERFPGGLPGAGTGTVAVVGDRWGALAASLAAHAPVPLVQIGDSYLGRRATLANLARAGAEDGAVRLLTTRDTPPERIDLLLVRVPKSLSLLEDQLHRLAPALHPGTVVVGTGMVKEIHTSTLGLFERLVGPTRTSLAVKKARLIHATPDPGLSRGPNPWPYRYELPADAPGGVAGRPVVNHAGVFCADRLDIGTRFFLNHLPTGLDGARVVDLGCGNGVLGLAVALAEPGAELLLTDESYQAVASARDTFRAAAPDARARFEVGDGLADAPAGSADVVLCNPPFHSHQATTDATARRMFREARRALRPGGELWVVGNRHLGHHVTLKRIFGGCRVVAGDPKFVVLRAERR